MFSVISKITENVKPHRFALRGPPRAAHLAGEILIAGQAGNLIVTFRKGAGMIVGRLF